MTLMAGWRKLPVGPPADHHPPGTLIQPMKTSSSKVTRAEINKEPRQPRRLLKKKNMVFRQRHGGRSVPLP